MATDLERLVVSLEANIKKFEREMARSRQSTDTAMRGVERRTQQATQKIESMMTRAGRSINTALSGILAGLSVQQVARYADSYTKVQNSLKVAGLEGQALKGVYDQLYASAQRQGVSLEAMATLYSRVSLSQKELNATSAEIVRLTETVGLALRVQGGDANSASSAMLQLSQALGSGKVQWEELNPLMDTAQPLLRAAAAGMKEAGGSVSTLAQLVKDGKVSSEAFFRSIEAGRDVLEEMARNTTPTLGQAMERVNNALTDAAGKMNAAVSATEGFQTAINLLIADIAKMPAGLQSTIHELERIIQLFGQAKALAREGLAATGLVNPRSRIDQAFDADSYAVHGSMRGYKRPVNDASAPLSLTVKPRRTVSLSDYAVPGEKEGGRGGGGKSSQERVNEYEREIEAIQRRTRALDAEKQTIGLSAGETAKAEAAFKLLEAAKEANVAVTPELKAQIDSLSAAYGEATQKIEDAREAQEAVADAAHEVGNILSSAFQDAILEGEELDKVLQKLMKSLASKAIDNIFNSLFSGGSGGLGGLLGGLFNPTGRASGGQVKPGVAYTVGESGRETFVPTQAGRIIPNGKGGGSMQVVINNNAGAQVQARQVQGPQGPRLEVQIEQMLGGMVASGGLDKALKQRFGVNPMGGR